MKGKVKLSLRFAKDYAVKKYRGVEVWFHTFVTKAIDGD